MLNTSSPLARLLTAPMRPGEVCWLGVRGARRAPPTAVASIRLHPVHGIAGDHYAGRSGSRQVTLIGVEQLAAIASFLGRAEVLPEELRRNVVVRGLNLHAVKGGRLRLGSAILKITGDCHPCSRMEEAFGPGGYNAVRGHGGLTAQVMEAGEVKVSDFVFRVDEEAGSGPKPAPEHLQRLFL